MILKPTLQIADYTPPFLPSPTV